MAIHDDILDAVTALIDAVGLYALCGIGSLPADNGISAYLSTGSSTTTYLNKKSKDEAFIVVNAKHTDNRTALSALSAIHSALTKIRDYPHSDNYQIFNIETSTSPNFISHLDNGQWIYGSILKIKFYNKGE